MGRAGGPAGVGAGTERFQHSEVSARSEVFTKCSGAHTTDQFIPFFNNYFQKMYPVLSLGPTVTNKTDTVSAFTDTGLPVPWGTHAGSRRRGGAKPGRKGVEGQGCVLTTPCFTSLPSTKHRGRYIGQLPAARRGGVGGVA